MVFNKHVIYISLSYKQIELEFHSITRVGGSGFQKNRLALCDISHSFFERNDSRNLWGRGLKGICNGTNLIVAGCQIDPAISSALARKRRGVVRFIILPHDVDSSVKGVGLTAGHS